jgi:hypothetical protein
MCYENPTTCPTDLKIHILCTQPFVSLPCSRHDTRCFIGLHVELTDQSDFTQNGQYEICLAHTGSTLFIYCSIKDVSSSKCTVSNRSMIYE